MKITLSNFNYKGYRFDYYESELPQVDDVDEIFVERIMGYITENLDNIIKEEESK